MFIASQMSQNDSSDVIEKWRSGVEFSFAWFKLAEPDAIAKFREARSPRAARAQQSLMVADLWARINCGELQAIGKCVAPEISNGPILIPSHTFELRPPQGIEESEDFEISGWRYESVTIIRTAKIEPNAIVSSISPVAKIKRGGGRPDTYPYSKNVLQILYAIGGNDRLSAQKLHPVFELEFYKQFPREQYQISAPSVRTLRDQIELFRK